MSRAEELAEHLEEFCSLPEDLKAAALLREQDKAINLMRAALEKLKSNSVARDALKAADKVLK